MVQRLFLFFVLLGGMQAYAEKRDSLCMLLQQCTQDEQRIRLQNELFWAYIFEYPDSAKMYTDQSLLLIDTTDYSNTSIAHNNLGIYHYFVDDFAKAEKQYKLAIRYAQKSGDSAQWAKCINNLAIIKDITAHYDLAIQLYRKAAQIHKQQNKPIRYAETLNNIAVVYKTMGHYTQALQVHRQSVAIHKKLNNIDGLAYDYNNMGLIYFDLGKKDSSIYYHQHAQKYYHQLNSPLDEASTFINLANAYSSLALYNIALEYYDQAKKMYQTSKQFSGVAICLVDIASCKAHLEEYASAKEDLIRADTIYRNMEYPDKQLEGKFSLFSLLLKLQKTDEAALLINSIDSLVQKVNTLKVNGTWHMYHAQYYGLNGANAFAQKNYQQALRNFEKIKALALIGKTQLLMAKQYLATKQLPSAVHYAQKALHNGEKSGEVLLQQQTSALLQQLYTQQKQYAKALAASERNMLLKDSILKTENIKKAIALQVKENYDLRLKTEKQAFAYKQHLLSNQLNHQKRIIQLAILATILILAILVGLLIEYHKKKQAHLILVAKADELAQKQAQTNKKRKKRAIASGNMLNAKITTELEGKMEALLYEQKAYLKQGLKLTDLAKTLHTNSNYLSRVINTQYGKNFNQLINEFRIKEACMLIHNGKHENLTIEGIAKSVGYTNRATFIDAFKKINGVTPSFYISSIRKKKIAKL